MIRIVAFALLALVGCRQDMHDTPRYEPFEASDIFANGSSARPQVPGTVARGELEEDDHFYRGRAGKDLVTTFPLVLSSADMKRGQQRYDIFCSPCHGEVGDATGMVVQRGFPAPPSFHIDRLRNAPVGHFFDVITRGFGRMYPYGDRIPARDRWLIVAYVRALQRSQNASLSDVPLAMRDALRSSHE